MSHVAVPVPDLEKLRDALQVAYDHHRARDEANAAVHLAEPRLSPLTSRLAGELDRCKRLLLSARVARAERREPLLRPVPTSPDA